MNFAPALTTELEKLVGLEPGLLHDLRTSETTHDAVERITAAARRHGMVFDTDELTAYLEKAASHEVADEMLDSVTGGDRGLPISWWPGRPIR